MSEVGQQETQPPLPPVHAAALEKIQIIAGEYFEDYLIVVSKGKVRYDCWRSEDDAYGKAHFVMSKISKKWWGENNKG